MKKIALLFAATAMAAIAQSAMGAALITKGSNELALQGKMDFATFQGAEIKLDVRYAYFLFDRFSMGAKGTIYNNDAVNHFGIGGLAEYNFALPANYKPMFGTDMVPYLGGGIEYRHAKLFDEKESAVVFVGEGGMKFFLTDTTAITLALVGELATEEIYADDLDATDKDLSLQLGMRMYF